ncbi:hypothetical protein [Bradyrhizobium sp. LMTR 3]|uniref:hypothetical protein n=1 Tax=Bradyrhizobium sp. LMTR 3 TaxID=189873 RepID=UPI000810C22E|nr:hypothetical protein [Bradyrhizobium sp. LMTR 3]OCK59663.1 hypothetical protein LMTR3_18580 [Bradyrhizobium sp. LMTR 3]
MTYRTTLIASLSAVALVLAAGEALADPGVARGAGVAPSRPGVAPARPAFPAFRSMHHHHHRGGGFFPGVGGVFYGLPTEVEQPVVVEAPPLKQSDDLRFTCVYDIPWDYVHRCPQFNTPRY